MEIRHACEMSQARKAGEQGQGRQGEGRGGANCGSEGPTGAMENSHGDHYYLQSSFLRPTPPENQKSSYIALGIQAYVTKLRQNFTGIAVVGTRSSETSARHGAQKVLFRGVCDQSPFINFVVFRVTV